MTEIAYDSKDECVNLGSNGTCSFTPNFQNGSFHCYEKHVALACVFEDLGIVIYTISFSKLNAGNSYEETLHRNSFNWNRMEEDSK